MFIICTIIFLSNLKECSECKSKANKLVKLPELSDQQMNDLERYSLQEQSAKMFVTYCFIPWLILALFYRAGLYVGMGARAFNEGAKD